MSQKHLKLFAIIMVVVFLAITIAYPMLFKPGPKISEPKANMPLPQTAAPVGN